MYFSCMAKSRTRFRVSREISGEPRNAMQTAAWDSFSCLAISFMVTDMDEGRQVSSFFGSKSGETTIT